MSKTYLASTRSHPDFLPGSGDPGEHRRRVQQAADERAAQRGIELESQTSPLKNAQERIGIWEQLHELRLPRTSGHALVRVIARQTGLTVGEIHAEQQRRAGTSGHSG